MDADVEATTQHGLEGADTDIERSGDCAGHQRLPNASRNGHRDLESLRHAEILSRVNSL